MELLEQLPQSIRRRRMGSLMGAWIGRLKDLYRSRRFSGHGKWLFYTLRFHQACITTHFRRQKLQIVSKRIEFHFQNNHLLLICKSIWYQGIYKCKFYFNHIIVTNFEGKVYMVSKLSYISLLILSLTSDDVIQYIYSRLLSDISTSIIINVFLSDGN